MNIWKISVQNVKSKPLYSLLSVFVLALSTALLIGIQQLETTFKHQIDHNLGAIDLVVGAKGSPLQLVLSSVLHIDNPTGNIPYEAVEKLQKNPSIKAAVPIAYGDNYKGFRIVGTRPEYLALYHAKIQDGHPINAPMQALLGHEVATRLQLKIGDTFLGAHGLITQDLEEHEEAYRVVGILEAKKQVIDRLIITTLESVWEVHNHEDNGHETPHDQHKHEEHEQHKHKPIEQGNQTHKELHEDSYDQHKHEDHEQHKHKPIEQGNQTLKELHEDSHDQHKHEDHEQHNKNHQAVDDAGSKEITSLLISFRNPSALLTLPRSINKNTNMQAALPKYELDKLYQNTGIGFKTIALIAYIILFISGLTIFISLYRMVKERAFDLALLRSYGASNFQLIRIITYEGLIIVSFALVLGFLCTKLGLYFILEVLENDFQQISLQTLPIKALFHIIGMVLATTILAVVLAIYPIVKMNISTILSNEK